MATRRIRMASAFVTTLLLTTAGVDVQSAAAETTDIRGAFHATLDPWGRSMSTSGYPPYDYSRLNVAPFMLGDEPVVAVLGLYAWLSGNSGPIPLASSGPVSYLSASATLYSASEPNLAGLISQERPVGHINFGPLPAPGATWATDPGMYRLSVPLPASELCLRDGSWPPPPCTSVKARVDVTAALTASPGGSRFGEVNLSVTGSYTLRLEAPGELPRLPVPEAVLDYPDDGAVYSWPLPTFFVNLASPRSQPHTAHVEFTNVDTGEVRVVDSTPTSPAQQYGQVEAAMIVPATYTWRARFVDPNGNTGPWSAARRVTLLSDPIYDHVSPITDLVHEIGDDASPAAPELVAPTNAASFPFGQPEEFVVKATDPDGEPYTATVTVEDAVTGAQRTFASLPTPSGSAATAPIMDGPLAVGPYRWWATATDLTGHTGPPSATRTFSVVTS